MDIKKTVFLNLSRFKEYLASFASPPKKGERKYPILVDLSSGEIRFLEKVQSFSKGQSISLKEPKRSSLIVRDKEDGSVSFEIKDPIEHEAVKKTLKILNAQGKETRDASFPESAMLANLSPIHAELFRKEVETLSSWRGDLTVEEAEKELEGKRVGTYLLLKGSDVLLMVEQMQEHYGYEIHPYLLLTLEDQEKVSEKLILGLPWGWILYGDEPDLQCYQAFEDPQDLLKSLEK